MPGCVAPVRLVQVQLAGFGRSGLAQASPKKRELASHLSRQGLGPKAAIQATHWVRTASAAA